jgi:PAS domain S-box-containing protein
MSFTGAARPRPITADEPALPTRGEVRRKVSGIRGAPLRVIFAFRQAPDGSFTFPFVSPAFEQDSGISRKELARDATPILRSIHPEDIGRVVVSVAESAEKLTDWRCEFRINSPTKGEMWLEGHSIPQRNADGSTLWYGYVHGVTARKRAELAVQRSEHKLHAYIQNAPIAVIVVDRNGYIVDGNPEARELLGYDFSAVASLSVFDLHPAEERGEVRARLEALSIGDRVDVELRWIRRDGQEIWVLLRAVRLDDGQSIGLLPGHHTAQARGTGTAPLARVAGSFHRPYAHRHRHVQSEPALHPQ